MSDLRCRALFGLVAFLLVAVPGRASMAQQHDAARGIAAQNAELVAEIADGTSALDRARADLAQLHKSKDDLEESMHRIERSAQVHTHDGEFARTVIEELRVLPKPGRFTGERIERGRMLEATSDADLRDERRLRELGDLDAAVARRLAGGAAARVGSATASRSRLRCVSCWPSRSPCSPGWASCGRRSCKPCARPSTPSVTSSNGATPRARS